MPVALHTYTILIFISCCNYLFISFYTQVKRDGRGYAANAFLGAFCFFLCVANADYILAENHFYYYFPLFIGLGEVTSLLLGPLLYLYVLFMTGNRPALKWQHLLHLLPAILYMIWVWDYEPGNRDALLRLYHQLISGAIPIPPMILYYNKIVILIYVMLTYALLKKHRKVVTQLLSNADENSLNWIRNLSFSIFPLYLLWLLQYQKWIDENFYGLAALLFSYWIGYHVIRQKGIYTALPPDFNVSGMATEGLKYRNSTLTADKKKRYTEQLNLLMETEKPFRDKELSLTMLATKLQIKPGYLSQILNEDYGESFYNFINRHRIEESKLMLADQRFRHYNIMSIAYEAGFNSKSTFNKAFREQVGLSPSAYQKNHPSFPAADPRSENK